MRRPRQVAAGGAFCCSREHPSISSMGRRPSTTGREEGMHRGLALLLAALATIGLASAAHADEAANAYNTLQTSSVYISPGLLSSGHARASDGTALRSQATASAKTGIPEKFALLTSLPKRFAPESGAAYRAAVTLRKEVSLTDGVLVLVWPHGIGVSASALSLSEIESIESTAAPICETVGFGACALRAGKDAEAQVRSDQATTQHDALVFWSIVLLVIAAVIGYFVWRAARLRRRVSGRLDELRAAAGTTLAMTDTAVQAIEVSGTSMAPDLRVEYDRALGLRDRARRELERSATQAGLIQANNDAAQAVLALQGMMKRLNISDPLVPDGLDLPDHRCFYCGRSDRPPYTERTISDGQGNSMQVEVCSFCMGQLQAGRTPQVATVQHDGLVMPWWAVPSTPYYYAYGGPSWQYWLPFLIGMDVGGWFGGGMYGAGYGLGAGYVDTGVMQPGDMGAGDFGVGADWTGPGDGGAGDFGGGDWGGGDGGAGDLGGGDFGGDVGSGDFGGGDFGGGDWS
jgi:hypothetical protein